MKKKNCWKDDTQYPKRFFPFAQTKSTEVNELTDTVPFDDRSSENIKQSMMKELILLF